MKNKPRKFRLFVKQYDEDGAIDIRKCGWINANPKLHIVNEFSNAQTFEDRKSGHGSVEDWIEYFTEENPKWDITVRYVD